MTGFQDKYRVVFEAPDAPDAPASILTPDPNWMAEKMSEGLTEEAAIEALIQKDIPPSVWRDYKGNRSILRIVPVEMIPSDRSFRNAWKISQEAI